MSETHILPKEDLVVHEHPGDECVCGPDVEFVTGGIVVSHHSLDGRDQQVRQEPSKDDLVT